MVFFGLHELEQKNSIGTKVEKFAQNSVRFNTVNYILYIYFKYNIIMNLQIIISSITIYMLRIYSCVHSKIINCILIIKCKKQNKMQIICYAVIFKKK